MFLTRVLVKYFDHFDRIWYEEIHGQTTLEMNDSHQSSVQLFWSLRENVLHEEIDGEITLEINDSQKSPDRILSSSRQNVLH